MQEISDSSPFHLINFLVLSIYILAQGIFYLIKKRSRKAERLDEIIDRRPVRILIEDLKKLEAKMIALDRVSDAQGIMISNKLDLILTQFDEQRDDFKDMKKQHQDLNDRLIRLEVTLNQPRNFRKQ